MSKLANFLTGFSIAPFFDDQNHASAVAPIQD
jgi:hypothetical protein